MPRSMLLGRTVQADEPEWLEEDLDAVLEYLREEKIRCPGCGLPRDETMRPDAEFKFASKVFRCHACAARDRATEKWHNRGGSSYGVHFTVEEVE